MISFTANILISLLFVAQPVPDIETQKEFIFDKKVEFIIPTEFSQLNDQEIQERYPSGGAPTMIYADPSRTVNVAINYSEGDADQESLSEIKDALIGSYEMIYPDASWFDKGIKEVNGRKVAFHELTFPIGSVELYNLVFYTDLNGKLLTFTFNCSKNDVMTWQVFAHEMLESVVVKQ